MTFITYLWVLLITLNVSATHLDFSKCSDNFGQKNHKALGSDPDHTDSLNIPTVT